MLVYSVFMFVVSAVFMVLTALIYKGKTNLIHDYHQTNVADKAAYAKAFGKALCVVAMAPLISGMIGLLGESKGIVCSAVVALIVGIAMGIVCILSVQKKYNGGLF